MYRWSSRSHFLSQSRSRSSLKSHTHTLVRLEPAAHQTTDRQTDGGIKMAWRGASAVVILLSITPVSAFSFYDPNLCYILDALFLLYGIIITAFFVRERCIKKKSKGDQDSLYQPIDKRGQSAYDVLRGAEEGPARGGRKRGDDTYTPLQKKSDETYREIETKPGRRRTDQVYQGLSSMTKDTYDSLHMQQIHPPPR
ncbi:T-cell surface glycoprotein CD3 zeta chain isoform X3 [Sinocyclocheilus grahami]|uniref:T-cell surface glycoprotein CD3 zeta chain isoform X3 n=1 Tax=Sinocyclocheilus grahami TaxID=75366 RepID=UPI0007AC93BC|nr:PREDICTED: T-cell surface glycoprotein CD3 zeta chain isoform X3 [Sinocyclocheilus grahami]